MRKTSATRFLSLLLALAMVLSLSALPVFATDGEDAGESTGETVQTQDDTGTGTDEESNTGGDTPAEEDDDTGDDSSAEGTANDTTTEDETGAEDESIALGAAQAEEETTATAIEAVQALIDALPAVDEVAAMDTDGQNEVYTAFLAACEAYDALTAEEQVQVDDSALDTLADYFNGLTVEAEDDDETAYTEWTDSTSLPTSGTYKLMTDVTFTSYITIAAGSELTLDLNGHTITHTTASYICLVNGTLMIEDSAGNGQITTTGSYGIALVGSNAVLNYTGGTLTSTNTISNSSAIHIQAGKAIISGGTITGNGYVINVTQSGSSVEITGGTITPGTCGVHLGYSSSATISGGTISGGTHGVYVDSDSSVTVTGGSITGSGYGLYIANGSASVSGSPTITGDGTYYTSAGYVGYGIYIGGGTTTSSATATVSGGTIIGKTDGIVLNDETAKLTLSGGTITGTDEYGVLVYYEEAEATITDGTISGGRYGVCCAGITTISGGSVSGTLGAIANYTYSGSGVAVNGTVTVSGGTYSSNVASYLASDCELTYDSTTETYTASVTTTTENVATVTDCDGNTIGSYTTLAAAVEAANTGYTVTLLKDTTGSGVKIDTSEKSITIDLGGYTYTITDPTVGSTGTETNGFHLSGSGTLTIQNGTLKPGTSSANILIQNYCNLTLSDVTIDTSDYTTCVYAVSNNNGSLTLTGNTTITVADGQTAFDLYYWPSGGYGSVSVSIDSANVTINGNIEYGSDGTDSGKTGVAENATLTISAGTIKGEISVTDTLDTDGETGISITGGTFSTNVSAYTATGYVAIYDESTGTYTVETGTYVASVTSGETVTKYTSLDAAISAANDGDTVTLLGDTITGTAINVTVSIKIDFNGYNYEYTASETTDSGAFYTQNSATVTFRNSAGSDDVSKVKVSSGVAMPVLSVKPGTTATVEANVIFESSGAYPTVFIGESTETTSSVATLNVYGTIKNTGTSNNRGTAIQGNGTDKTGGTVINIYEGAVVSSDTTAIYHPQYGTLNIFGGTIEGYCAIGISNGTLNISGGTIRGIVNDNELADTYSTDGLVSDGSAIVLASAYGDVQLNITGGTIESYYSYAIRAYYRTNSTNTTNVAISESAVVKSATAEGATEVTSDLYIPSTYAEYITAAISGGSFSSVVDEAYCATGYEPSEKDTETNLYTVTLKDGYGLVENYKTSAGGEGIDVDDPTTWKAPTYAEIYPDVTDSNMIFAGWYVDDTCEEVYTATTGTAYAKFVQLSSTTTENEDGTTTTTAGIINFLGGSLRKDSTEYTTTSLRFGYDIVIPADCKTTEGSYSWSWEWTADGAGDKTLTVNGVYYTSLSSETYNSDYAFRSNLVITDIPLSGYSTNVYSTLTVCYVTADGTTVFAMESTQKRSVSEVANTISTKEGVSTSDKEYADGILEAIQNAGSTDSSERR